MPDDSEELDRLRRRVADLEDRPSRRSPRLGCGSILAIGFVVLLAVTCLRPERAPDPKMSNGMSEAENKFSARLAVEARLKDPDSAKFSPMTVRDKDGVVTVCGDVNAKNGFGGYGGDQSYIVTGKGALFAKDVGGKTFLAMWKSRCA